MKKLLFILASFCVTGIAVEKAVCHGPHILATYAPSKHIQVFKLDPTALTRITNADQGTAATTPFPVNNSISWSPNGLFLAAAATVDGNPSKTRLQIYSFDGDTFNFEREIAPSEAHDITAVSWSSDCQFIAIGTSTSGSVQVFKFDSNPDLENSEALTLTTSLSSSGDINDVRWSPTGHHLAVVGIAVPGHVDAELEIFSFDGSELTSEDTFDHGAELHVVRWSPFDTYLAVGGVSGTGSKDLRLFSFNGTILTEKDAELHDSTIKGLAWAPNDLVVATGAINGTVETWQFSRSLETLTTYGTGFHN